MATATQIRALPPFEHERRFIPEFELVLACCDHALRCDITSLLTPDLDWQRVLESAEHHRLIPPLHAALAGENAVPSTLRTRAHKHAWRVLHFTTELEKIARGFERRGIEFIAHKGPALSQLLYGSPAQRQFGDLDLIVRPRDVTPAKDALIELGFIPQLRLSPLQERALLHSGYECSFGLSSERHLVELQWQIVPRFCSIKFDMDALFRRSARIQIDGLCLSTLGNEDLLLALCVHAAKHEWSELGMLRDLAALTTFKLDWNWIVAEARRLGILKILQVSLLAAAELFTVSSAVQPPVMPGAAELASAAVTRLEHNYQPNTESIRYFRDQIQTRERWRDRMRFVWRLATTPSVQEWQAVRIPDRCFTAYRGVRLVRLVKRFLS